MARRVVVVALVLFVVVGMAFVENVQGSAPPPTDLDGKPDIDHVIGTNDDGLKSPNALLGAPMGGPIPLAAFAKAAAATETAASAHSGTSALHVSAFVGVASTAVGGFFYF